MEKIVIRLGMVDLTDQIFIERKVIDSKFPVNKETDLALLKLDRKVFFHQAISPICLPDKTYSPSEQYLVIAIPSYGYLNVGQFLGIAISKYVNFYVWQFVGTFCNF